MAGSVEMKKKGNRGGANPGSGNPGRLPYGAIVGGQSSADPVAQVKATQDKNRKAIGYGEH